MPVKWERELAVELSMDETLECEGGGIGVMLLWAGAALIVGPGVGFGIGYILG